MASKAAHEERMKSLRDTPGYIPPAQRERCAFCSKPLNLVCESEWVKPADGTYRNSRLKRMRFTGYDSNAPFCTLRCGLAFAQVCYRDGVRMASKEVLRDPGGTKN